VCEGVIVKRDPGSGLRCSGMTVEVRIPAWLIRIDRWFGGIPECEESLLLAFLDSVFAVDQVSVVLSESLDDHPVSWGRLQSLWLLRAVTYIFCLHTSCSISFRPSSTSTEAELPPPC